MLVSQVVESVPLSRGREDMSVEEGSQGETGIGAQSVERQAAERPVLSPPAVP